MRFTIALLVFLGPISTASAQGFAKAAPVASRPSVTSVPASESPQSSLIIVASDAGPRHKTSEVLALQALKDDIRWTWSGVDDSDAQSGICDIKNLNLKDVFASIEMAKPARDDAVRQSGFEDPFYSVLLVDKDGVRMCTTVTSKRIAVLRSNKQLTALFAEIATKATFGKLSIISPIFFGNSESLAIPLTPPDGVNRIPRSAPPQRP